MSSNLLAVLILVTTASVTQVFQTTPTSELVTQFPLALVPTFLVPLAFAMHVVSLWQLLLRDVREGGFESLEVRHV
jgi:hypothetical protein